MNNDYNPNPIHELVSGAMQTAASLPVQTSVAELSPRRSPEPSRRKDFALLRTSWQQRFLELDAHHDDVQRMADEAQEFARNWVQNTGRRRLLVLVGNSGSGKTHVLNRVYSWARASTELAWGYRRSPGPPIVMKKYWPRIVDGFKEGAFDVLEDLADADLLMLDDVGAEYDRGTMSIDKLCQTLTRREWRFTMMTMNIATDKWISVFGERVMDRLLRRSSVVSLVNVPSYSLLSFSL